MRNMWKISNAEPLRGGGPRQYNDEVTNQAPPGTVYLFDASGSPVTIVAAIPEEACERVQRVMRARYVGVARIAGASGLR